MSLDPLPINGVWCNQVVAQTGAAAVETTMVLSRTRSSRERKALTNQPRKCRSDAIIAGIISEKSESSFVPSHSFCRCTTFWRGTTNFGADLVLGLLTPLCTLLLLVNMIIAIATNRIHSIQTSGLLAWVDDFLYLPEVLYVLILVWLIFSGPGRYSVDGLIARQAGVAR
jgi:hypothetical protein